jgi:hypothetical protein
LRCVKIHEISFPVFSIAILGNKQYKTFMDNSKLTDEPFINMEVGETRYFKTRTTKGGVYIAASVWIEDGERDEIGRLLSDQIHGLTIGNNDILNYAEILLKYPFFVSVEKSEYDYLKDLKTWAENNDETSPFATEEKVDFNNINLPF